MNRRKFFRNGSLFTLGAAVMNPFQASASILDIESVGRNKKAKNIIFMVSDGMSSGTLNMADLFLNRKYGKGSNWLQLYRDNKVSRALMDTASANSIVTDSSAGSSSWGGGFRVNNGSLNVGPNGEEHLPILQKFKKAGKMAGCVTTVAITHATPAGFCVNSKKRSAMDDIAEMYLDLEFDVMLGGGKNHFDASLRKDKKDLFSGFYAKGYQVAKTRDELLATNNNQPILGVFEDDAVPYSIDRQNDANLQKKIPTLAEMTQKAIDRMKDHKKGFVLQVESGKVDWAAHANDIAGLIHDQIAFDDAIKVAMDFAEKDRETLVIITTDHGNANPGVIYGKKANDNFDVIQKYTQTNEAILNSFNANTTVSQIKEKFKTSNSHAVSDEEAKEILSYYNGLHKSEDGLYNYKKLPFKALSDIQQKYNSVGWISMDHSADYVELAAYGPGSALLKPFVKNTDMHYLMLQAAEVENKF
ncbi:alkaline phosphatase [Flavobacterium sp. NST-5]|uniref:Alkaline phosphatase n=1 Tax=Flavobacterium ichthyis TaxID=2698827 RepID=A0ABW9Z677_9FLAO|nr:alkaline phosphatase [Flavobacterium ichthyis]NBL64352.1 alkaline phosphatase [Flavobacterium ichthyis]